MPSPDEFLISAQEVLKGAPDLHTGYANLTTEYEANRSDDPDEQVQNANTLAEYGQYMRQKFYRDNAPVGDISAALPFKEDEMPVPDIEDPKEKEIARVDMWAQANNEYLDVADDPKRIMNKNLLKKGVKELATLRKQQINDPGEFEDTASRIALGALAPLTTAWSTLPDNVKTIMRATGKFLPGNVDIADVMEAEEFLKEHTNVGKEDDWFDTLSSVVGTAAGTIGLSVIAAPLGIAYIGAGAVGAVAKTYQDIKETTGDSGAATKAAAIEAGGQVFQLWLGGRALAGLGKRLGSALYGAAKPLEEATTKGAVKGIIKGAAGQAVRQGAAAGGAKTASNLAQGIGLDEENIDYLKGVGTAVSTAAVVGAAAETGVRGVEATRAGIKEATEPTFTEESNPEAFPLTTYDPSEQAQSSTDVARVVINKPSAPFPAEHTHLNDPNASEFPVYSPKENPPTLYEETGEVPIRMNDLIEPPAISSKYMYAEEEPAFNQGQGFVKSDDRAVYVQREDGKYEPKELYGLGVGASPDRFYIATEIATKASILKHVIDPTGQSPVLTKDGDNVYIKSEYVTPDLDVSDTPTGSRLVKLPTTRIPAAGLHPVDVGEPSYDGNVRMYPSNIGNPVREGELLQLAEKTPNETAGSKPMRLAERIRDNKNLAPEIREAFQIINPDGSLDTSLKYVEQTNIETNALANEYIKQQGGMHNALVDLLTGPNNRTADEIFAAANILDNVSAGIEKARVAEDYKGMAKLRTISDAIQLKVAKMGPESGRAVQAFIRFQKYQPQKAVLDLHNDLLSRLYEDQLLTEGIPLEKAHLEEQEVARITEELAQLPKETAEAPLKPEVKIKREALTAKKTKLELKISERIRELTKSAYELFTPEERQKYEDVGQLIQKFPENSTEQKIATTELLKLKSDVMNRAVRGNKGKVRAALKRGARIANSYYINNLLAEIGTHATNIFYNLRAAALGAGSGVIGAALRGENPLVAAKSLLIGAFENQGANVRSAAEILRHGGVSKFTSDYVDLVTEGPPVLNMLGYVSRALTAMDTIGVGTVEGAWSRMLLTESPEAKALSGRDKRNYIAETLYGSETAKKEAFKTANERAQALDKIGVKLSKGDVQQLAEEIIYQQRPKNIREEAHSVAERLMLRNTPDGLGGIVTKGLDGIKNAFKIPGTELRPLSYSILFTKVFGNLINAKLASTPLGAIHAATGKQLTASERNLMYSQSILGSIVLGSVFAVAERDKDSLSPQITFHGAGPKDAGKRDTLRASGWKEWSVQIGDQYKSFIDHPLAAGFAAMGAYLDAKRYSPDKDTVSEVDAITMAGIGMTQSLLNTSFTQQLMALGDIAVGRSYAGDRTKGMQQWGATYAGSLASGFVPGARFMKNMAAPFYSPIDARLDLRSKVLAVLPFANSMGGKPALNLFGEPANKDTFGFVSRFYTNKVTDPDIRFLADKGYYVPELSSRVEIPEEKAKGLIKKRKALNGAEYDDILDPLERYTLQLQSGPAVRKEVARLRRKYGNQPYDEKVQEHLNETVSKIRTHYKKKILTHEATPGEVILPSRIEGERRLSDLIE